MTGACGPAATTRAPSAWRPNSAFFQRRLPRTRPHARHGENSPLCPISAVQLTPKKLVRARTGFGTHAQIWPMDREPGPPSKAFCQSQEIEIKAELAIFPRKRVSMKTPQPISVRALPVSAKGLLGVNILVLQAPIRTRSVIRIDTIADRLPLLRLPLLCHLRLFFFSCKTLPAEAL